MNLKSKITTIAAATIFALSMGTAAYAGSTIGRVTQEITAGTVTYSISSATLAPVLYNESHAVDNGGMLQVYVTGNGNLDGWNLSVQATRDFEYVGASDNGKEIPAANLSLTQQHDPQHHGGQPIAATHGPAANPGGTGSLGSPIPVISSPVAHGSGTYSQDLDVSLEIPAGSQVGTYTGEVTVSMTSAPGGGED